MVTRNKSNMAGMNLWMTGAINFMIWAGFVNNHPLYHVILTGFVNNQKVNELMDKFLWTVTKQVMRPWQNMTTDFINDHRTNPKIY